MINSRKRKIVANLWYIKKHILAKKVNKYVNDLWSAEGRTESAEPNK
jgi:hypothetical protein